MPEPIVLHEKRGHVAYITLNRPDKLNAMTDGMLDDVLAGVRRAEEDDDIKAVVIKGAGSCFSSGWDLNEIGRMYGIDDVKSGERKLVWKNEMFANVLADDDFKARVGTKPRPDGGMELLELREKGEPLPLAVIPMEDSLTTHVVDFDKGGTTLYLTDSRDRDTAGVFALDLKTKKAKLLAEDAKADVSGLVIVSSDLPSALIPTSSSTIPLRSTVPPPSRIHAEPSPITIRV